jgi:hypothetical protein
MVNWLMANHVAPELAENQIPARDPTVDFLRGNLVFKEMHCLEMRLRLHAG